MAAQTLSTSVVRPSLARVAAKPARAQAVRPVAALEKRVAAVSAVSAAAVALAPAANAAQELAVVAAGEPLIVNVGWAALCCSFSMSLALVVWGRSGL